MYQERQSGFIFKNIILKLLLIVIIILVVVGLFPTKKYVENLLDQTNGTTSSIVFNSNLQTMKDAALSYYNGKRLPDKSDTLTLKQMLDKNLLTEVKDSNNKTCDTNKSYVTVTKNEDDYTLNISLTCNKKTKKIVSYFGSYNYCTSSVCEKKKIINETQENPNNSGSKDVSTKEEECLYTKSSNGTYKYTNWSDWTTEKISPSQTREVETKVEKVKVGTIDEAVGTTTITQSPKKVTAKKNGNIFVVYVCPADFDNGGSHNNPVVCTKTVTKYEAKDAYKNILYYRYRDKSYVNAQSDSKWSNCNDSTLINNGYTNTNQTR
ncbi:MAG: hypothetical protein IJ093_03800 [Bacilli bacterium]|nr:hypothetical protein [Bacilli bacterium]